MSDTNVKGKAGQALGAGLAATKQGGDIVRSGWHRWVTSLAGWNRARLAWASLAAAAVILVAVNVIASTAMRHLSADLTAERLFTISDGTRKVLSELDEPIRARVYFSKALGDAAPVYQKYFERVRALLQQYRDISRGRLELEFIDPEPFSDAEDRAVARGLKGIRLNREGETGYFGLLATNSTDHQSTVEFFAPERERFLEYDLTKLIYGLSSPKKRVVGLMTSLPMQGTFNPRGGMVPPWMVMEQMRDFFDVRTVGMDVDAIPADIDILMVVQPTVLPEKTQYAIDQFALKGGRILAFLDPVAESAQQNPQMPAMPPSGFEKLFKSWGIIFDAEQVAGDLRGARKVQFGGNMGSQPVVADYVAWIQLDKNALDEKDPLSAGIERLMFATPGFFAKAEGATSTFQPLVSTSAEAAPIPADRFRQMPDPLAILRDFKPAGKQLVLAARVTGEIATAFPDGPPKEQNEGAKPDENADDKAKAEAAKKKAEAEAAEAAAVAAQVKTGRLNAIVVADSDMLFDQFWANVRDFLGQRVVTPTAHNAVFALNALDNLSGSDTMMSLRARGIDDRPFTMVERIRQDAERRFRDKEQELQKKLEALQKDLASMETKGDGRAVLGEKDRLAIDKFRTEMVQVRTQLRDVKRELRKDIDRLDGTLKVINIAGVPLLIGFGALGLAWWRRRRDSAAG